MPSPWYIHRIKRQLFSKCLVYGIIIEIVYTMIHEIVLTYLNVEHSNMLKESHEIYEASIVAIVQSWFKHLNMVYYCEYMLMLVQLMDCSDWP